MKKARLRRVFRMPRSHNGKLWAVQSNALHHGSLLFTDKCVITAIPQRAFLSNAHCIYAIEFALQCMSGIAHRPANSFRDIRRDGLRSVSVRVRCFADSLP